MGMVIEALAGHSIVTLTSREPSLEEIFMHHYDRSSGSDAGEAAGEAADAAEAGGRHTATRHT
jgi:hypothetical protein